MSVEGPENNLELSEENISDEIVKMAEDDQAMRKLVKEDNENYDSSVDERNTELMVEIVDKYGWPTIGEFGEEVARKAWLLVQHADHNPEFQRKCINLMKELAEGEVDLKDMAFLEDRVLINMGEKQKYGTQFEEDEDGNLVPKPVDNIKEVDKRRNEVGMEPLLEYKKTMESLHKK